MVISNGMKTKIQKKSELKKLEAELPKAKIAIFTTFAREGEKGLSVGQIQELKRALRPLNSSYVTAKKTIVEIALRDLKYDGIDVYSMAGSLGVVMGPEEGSEDAINTVAKKLYEFGKKNQALQFFGALVNGKFIGKDEFSSLAQLPSREVVLSRLLGMMTYPIRGLAVALSEIAKKKATV